MVAHVVLTFHERAAELWCINKRRMLTTEEMTELGQCLHLNAKYVFEMAYLSNLSLLASMSNNVDWLHEICVEIEEVQLTGKRKKPGHKATD